MEIVFIWKGAKNQVSDGVVMDYAEYILRKGKGKKYFYKDAKFFARSNKVYIVYYSKLFDKMIKKLNIIGAISHEDKDLLKFFIENNLPNFNKEYDSYLTYVAEILKSEKIKYIEDLEL